MHKLKKRERTAGRGTVGKYAVTGVMDGSKRKTAEQKKKVGKHSTV